MITYKVRRHTKLIILHDSHTGPEVERIENWLRWNGRRLGLFDIGYHFIIDRDGHVTETRPQALIGTHCRGHDEESLGVCLIGGEDEHAAFTEEQRRSLFDLVQLLKRNYPGVALVGHDELTHSRGHKHNRTRACPSCDMGDLRDDYHQYVKSGGLVA